MTKFCQKSNQIDQVNWPTGANSINLGKISNKQQLVKYFHFTNLVGNILPSWSNFAVGPPTACLSATPGGRYIWTLKTYTFRHFDNQIVSVVNIFSIYLPSSDIPETAIFYENYFFMISILQCKQPKVTILEHL